MKRIMMMVLMLVLMSSVESYAGRGLFGCCCGGGDEDGECSESLIPDLGIHWIGDFEDFKKYYTPDGDCEMRVCRDYASIEIKETLKAGRGQKTLLFEGYDNDIMLKKVRGDVDTLIQLRGKKGTIMEKGRIIDCKNATIRRPNAGTGRGVPFNPNHKLF
jgi:hypothetical protein